MNGTVHASKEIQFPQAVGLGLRDLSAPLGGVDAAVQITPQAVQIGDIFRQPFPAGVQIPLERRRQVLLIERLQFLR